MALTLNPLWVQAGTYTARDERMGIIDPIYETPGKVRSTDLVVEATSPASMQVTISPGTAIIPTISSAFSTGKYIGTNSSTYTLTMPGSDAAQARKDLVVMRAYDSELTGTQDNLTIEVIQGTAASNPVVPSTPSMCLVLAVITVTANTSIITSDNIDTSVAIMSSANHEVFSGVPIFSDATAKDTYKSNVKSATSNEVSDLLYFNKATNQLNFESGTTSINLAGIKGFFSGARYGKAYEEGNQIIIQGTSSVETTNSSGIHITKFPKPFPNGVLLVVTNEGDYRLPTYFIDYPSNCSLSQWAWMVRNRNGNGLVKNTKARCNYLAIGW